MCAQIDHNSMVTAVGGERCVHVEVCRAHVCVRECSCVRAYGQFCVCVPVALVCTVVRVEVFAAVSVGWLWLDHPGSQCSPVALAPRLASSSALSFCTWLLCALTCTICTFR